MDGAAEQFFLWKRVTKMVNDLSQKSSTTRTNFGLFFCYTTKSHIFQCCTEKFGKTKPRLHIKLKTETWKKKLITGMKLISLIVLCCCAYTALATYGLDLSYFQGAVSVETFQCLASSGYEFAILEGTAGSSGSVNPYLGGILNSAKSAGIRYVDVYVFLDFERGDPRGQIQEVVSAIRNSGAPFDGMIWHDVGLFFTIFVKVFSFYLFLLLEGFLLRFLCFLFIQLL